MSTFEDHICSCPLTGVCSAEAATTTGQASLIIAQIAEEVTSAQGALAAGGTLTKRDGVDIDAVAQLLAEIVKVRNLISD